MITGDGVLGQVFRIGPFSSEIILITDAEHALPVQVVRSGVRTIALGTGRSTSLELPYVPQNYDVKVGDLLVTSGLGRVFPFGLPVARVTKVERDPDAAAGADPRGAARGHRNRSRSAVHLGAPGSSGRHGLARSTRRRGAGQAAGEYAMNLARREPRWAVSFTVLLALIAQVLPLPDWLSVVRPSFVALVIIYWSIYAPHAGGIFAPWLAGLALDVFKGDVLAQNALAIALVAYIAMSLHQRLRNQTLVQQSLFVFAMLTLNEFVVWGIEGWSGHAVATPWRWIQPMIGAMLWPFVALLVGRTHTRSLEAREAMGTVRIKDHWAEQRLFESRALAAAFIIAALTAGARRPPGGAAGDALRLLRRALAGQPRARRAAARAARPDPRSQRRRCSRRTARPSSSNWCASACPMSTPR